MSQGEVRRDSVPEIPPPKDMKSMRRIIGMPSYCSQQMPSFSDKINPLVENKTFSLPQYVKHAFDNLKKGLALEW